MIHATAIVDPGAELDSSVEVGPFAIIGPHVKAAKGVVIGPHAVVTGRTSLSEGVRVFQFASVGEIPQDLKFHGEPGRLEVGAFTQIREGATLHIGTDGGGLLTKVGQRCLLMAGTHVAHDCVVGNGVIMANYSALAGHVTVEDFAIFSGHIGVHQFTRIGRHAFISGGTFIAQDIAPFCFAQGERGSVVGINSEGLKRHGYDDARIRAVRQAFKILFRQGHGRDEACKLLEAEFPGQADVGHMVSFARASQRGLAAARRRDPDET